MVTDGETWLVIERQYLKNGVALKLVDAVGPPTWDYDLSAQIVEPGEVGTPNEYYIYVNNGSSSIKLSVDGSGFSFDGEDGNGQVEVEPGEAATLLVDNTASGTGTIYAEDDYYGEEVVGYVATPLLWDAAAGDAAIGQSDSETVGVTGGKANYTFSVSGTDFWLDVGHTITTLETSNLTATVYSGASACGTCTVTVTDGFGQVCGGYVLCTTGSWTLLCSVTPCAMGADCCDPILHPGVEYDYSGKYYFGWKHCCSETTTGIASCDPTTYGVSTPDQGDTDSQNCTIGQVGVRPLSAGFAYSKLVNGLVENERAKIKNG
jgi:hypothetical protein